MYKIEKCCGQRPHVAVMAAAGGGFAVQVDCLKCGAVLKVEGGEELPLDDVMAVVAKEWNGAQKKAVFPFAIFKAKINGAEARN